MDAEKPAQILGFRLTSLGAKRVAWLALLLTIQLLYFPINRGMQGGVVFDTPWDVHFPLRPLWVVPYLLSLAWWLGSYLWAMWKMGDELFRALVVSAVSIMLISYLFYILYPTYVVRPVVDGDGWTARLVSLLYANDRVNNAFPSGHTYNSVLIALYWSRWQRRLWPVWWGICIVVLLSTLYTRQHNLPDLAGGALLAWLGYHFGLWVSRRWPMPGGKS